MGALTPSSRTDDAEVGWRSGLLESERNHFKVARPQRAKRRVEHAIVPARVVGAAHEQIRAVVGDDETVSLHGAKDLLHLWRETRNAAARLQPQARAHRQRARRRSRAVR